MTLAPEPTRAAPPDAAAAPVGPSRRNPAAIAGLVLLVVTPILVGCVAFFGESWLPMSDWAHMTYRTSQVGTLQTPLVGAYSFHGFAHPGPLPFWLSAPLYRLTGADPRALLWTGALINVAAVVGLAAAAWRRGRWPLLLGTMLLTGLLIHGFGVDVVTDIWNPYSPLLPFLLTVFLVWDAALGRRRAVVEAIIPASYVAQAHIAFVPLVVALALWAVAWRRWGSRVVGQPEPAGTEAAAVEAAKEQVDGTGSPEPTPSPRWRLRWPQAIPRAAVVVLAVLWVGPILDTVFDMHNPGRVLLSMGAEQNTVGVLDAPSLVGTFVRPDGPLFAGGEPVMRLTISAADVLALVAALALMAACVVVARRRRLPDVAALATLTLVLLVVSVPGAARLLTPVMDYLTTWLKVVGALVWFTLGWAAWRVAEPRLQAGSGPRRRRIVGATAAVAVATSAAWSWGEATGLDARFNDGADQLMYMRAAVREGLDPDVEYRVEFAGDSHAYYPGLVYWLQHDGFDVVTADGAGGLKWGHDHRWVEGEPYERALMVAVHYGGSFSDAYAECVEDPGMRPVYEYDPLSPAERRWAEDVRFRRAVDPSSVTAAERQQLKDLYARGPQVAILTGDHLCGVPLAEGKQATG